MLSAGSLFLSPKILEESRADSFLEFSQQLSYGHKEVIPLFLFLHTIHTHYMLAYQLSNVIFRADPGMSVISLVTTPCDELYCLSALYGPSGCVLG